tara:strand:+ start:861 stop:1835 length:975 start_codon:yes stop_codon:yes gene_type:complete
MSFKKIEIDQLLRTKHVCEKKQFSYLLDAFQRKYKELYYDTDFLNRSVFLDNVNQIYIPKTLNKKTKKYSFYGHPIEIFSKNFISKIDYLKIQNYFQKIKSEKLFKFQIKLEQNLINKKIEKIEKVEQVINEIYIDLSKSIDEIKNNFSSTLRNEIKKDYENTKFEIIDKKNYKKNEILEMMNFHIKIAGRVTRSEQSWKQNEEMILNDKGFLIKVTHKDNLISFSFFFHNNFSCHYSSSVADREYYKKIRNMHHKSLWLAIKHAKTICKFFNVGSTTIYSKKNISDKEKNIEKFKSKFKGIDLKFVILNEFPEYDFYKNFLDI